MSTELKKRLIALFIVLASIAIALPLLFHGSDPLTRQRLASQTPSAPPAPSVSLSLPKQAELKSTIDFNSVTPPLVEQPASRSEAETMSASKRVAVINSSSTVKISSSEKKQKIVKPSSVINDKNKHSKKVGLSPVSAKKSNPSKTYVATEKKKKLSTGHTKQAQHADKKIPVSNKENTPRLSQDKPESIMAFNNTLDTPPAWVVQLASFSNEKNAHRLVLRLKDNGYDAYSRVVSSPSGKKIIRVFVGPEISKEIIQKVVNRLSQQYKLKGFIKRYTI